MAKINVNRREVQRREREARREILKGKKMKFNGKLEHYILRTFFSCPIVTGDYRKAKGQL